MARILVVDDDALDLMVLQSMLGKGGHDLVLAPDGAAALAVYQTSKFDLVVADLVMPSLNGLELIREILAMDPNASIIAISGMSPEYIPLAEDYGAIRALTKPLDAELFLRTVQEVLGRRDPDSSEPA
ncbi:MAG: response regulator [Gemmatimonadetes bacterium]|nr:response regulator [Gemmatimonadota bacterium]